MGMWGTAIFANDSALNFLDEVVDVLAHPIDTALGLERRGEKMLEVKPLAQVELADLDRIVLPSAAILLRLCVNPGDATSGQTDHGFTGGLLERIDAQAASVNLPPLGDPSLPDPVAAWSAAPPPGRVIRAWRERALTAFSTNVRIDEVSGDYLTERPGIIKLTFDRLEALAVEFEQE
jgi:hypothetical protein